VTITIMATVWFLAWQDPSRAPSAPAVSLIEKFRMLRVVGPMLLLFGMVTGVIYTGVATPTEASALGAFGATTVFADDDPGFADSLGRHAAHAVATHSFCASTSCAHVSLHGSARAMHPATFGLTNPPAATRAPRGVPVDGKMHSPHALPLALPRNDLHAAPPSVCTPRHAERYRSISAAVHLPW
jgi:hypothetical protein